MFNSGFTKRKTSFLKVEAVGTVSGLRAVARPSSCGWRWLSAWPVLGWAPLSGSSVSVGCKESRSPRPPLCRSGRWHCKACWSLELAGWPAEAPCRRAQNSWTPLCRENWREMWDLIIRLSRQMCFSSNMNERQQQALFPENETTLYLQAAEQWALPSAVSIHGDNAWHKRADYWRPKCWRNTCESFFLKSHNDI